MLRHCGTSPPVLALLFVSTADETVREAANTLKRGAQDRKVPARAMFQAMRTLEKAKLPVSAR